MANNTINGKAFEYACLKQIEERIKNSLFSVEVEKTKPFKTAQQAYEKLSVEEKPLYDNAAKTGVKIVFGLEPNLSSNDREYILSIASDRDAQGENGDVRDVLVKSKDGKWEVGFSCKHNHEALKHPRITSDYNFGKNWIGISCSDDFLSEMRIIMAPIEEYSKDNVLWRNVTNKEQFYVQVLEAYMKEIESLCKRDKRVPAKLMSYWFGANDFYKIIMEQSNENTKIEAFNIKNTLGRSYNNVRPAAKVPRLNYPNRLIHIERKISDSGVLSNTTLILYFDKGWTVSLRLHNKDLEATPTSLAWDVNLEGLPLTAYINTRGWKE